MTYSTHDSEQAALIRRLFDGVAAHYEQAIIPFFGVLARSFIEPIAENIALQQMPGHVLDVGTGTGIVPRLLATRLPPDQVQIVGIDIAPQMLNMARYASAAPNVHYLAADIHDPPFAPASFDLITASFGLNTTRPRRSLKQIRRLLKPGGWLIFQEWGPNDAVSETLEKTFAAFVPDELAEQIDAMTHLRGDWEAQLQDVEDYSELLSESGFSAVQATESTPTAVYALSIEPFITYKTAWSQRQLALQAMNAPTREALYVALRTELARFTEPDGSLIWRPPLFWVSARG